MIVIRCLIDCSWGYQSVRYFFSSFNVIGIIVTFAFAGTNGIIVFFFDCYNPIVYIIIDLVIMISDFSLQRQRRARHL
uniref:Uncharacterized protein n=1 Tax=Glossina austeni TaxID=7395 RepID=A0A1A9UJT5_GLOAU